MNDMNTSAELSVREIQAALDAGPTEGPWGSMSHYGGERLTDVNSDQPFTCVLREGGSWPEETIAEVWGSEHDDEINAVYIASCNPANMRNVLALIQSQAAEIERMRAALETVADWRLPPTGEVWPSGAPVSYETNYGSNGAMDYFRKLARSALATTQPKG